MAITVTVTASGPTEEAVLSALSDMRAVHGIRESAGLDLREIKLWRTSSGPSWRGECVLRDADDNYPF